MSGPQMRSALSGPAIGRAAVVAVGLAALWLAVLWAVAAP